MLVHMAYAIALVFGTVFIHAGCTVGVLEGLRSVVGRRWVLRGALRRVSVLGALVLVMSLVAFVESSLWAGLYVTVGALPTFHESLYFSLVTFTTLGYGDVTLPEDWRMLGAFQAANGILIFGWTTALIVNVAQRVYPHRGAEAGKD